MVEIYISISQFSAHPSGQPLNHMWQDGKQSVTWDCWWGGQHFWSHSSLHQIILLFGKFVVFVPLLKNCKKFEKIARTKALSLENVHKKSMKKHSTMSRNALETKKNSTAVKNQHGQHPDRPDLFASLLCSLFRKSLLCSLFR